MKTYVTINYYSSLFYAKFNIDIVNEFIKEFDANWKTLNEIFNHSIDLTQDNFINIYLILLGGGGGIHDFFVCLKICMNILKYDNI